MASKKIKYVEPVDYFPKEIRDAIIEGSKKPDTGKKPTATKKSNKK